VAAAHARRSLAGAFGGLGAKVGIMKATRVSLLVFAVLFASSPSHARSLLDTGPLAHIDSLAVEVMIGDALGLEPDRGTPLFDSDHERAAQLQSDLVGAATAHLRTGGMQVVGKSDNVIQFGLFGGKFKGGSSDSKNFFMVQVTVCPAADGRCAPARTVLGVVDDASLPRSLIAAAVDAVDVFTAKRTRWRQSRH